MAMAIEEDLGAGLGWMGLWVSQRRIRVGWVVGRVLLALPSQREG